ncbi:MAG: hypothetical protein JOY84_18130 [Curvibacter sp.]|nr:hypothetical protein [Curvibacter sp.]
MAKDRSIKKTPDEYYYYGLKKRLRRFKVDIQKRKWFDLWHEHPDFEGFGDLSWRHKRRHLSMLLRTLTKARIELQNSGMQYQIFAAVYTNESANNAVYVHTPNPNGSQFPCELSGTPLDAMPMLLAGRVDPMRYQVLAIQGVGGTTYVIQPQA